jgi:hypothetical protein
MWAARQKRTKRAKGHLPKAGGKCGGSGWWSVFL